MLNSKFFSIANLGEKANSLFQAVGGGKSSAVFYGAQNTRYFLTTRLDKFFLYVTQDRITARDAHTILNEYASGEVVLIPEKDELLLNVSMSSDVSLNERMHALNKIVSGQAVGAVISAEGLLQYFPKKEAVKEATINIKAGDNIPPENIVDSLISGGYRKEDVVTLPGEFAVRGDILDIFPAGELSPIRIEFFGDVVEKMRVFAPETMISIREVDACTIVPKSDVLLPRNIVNSILNQLNSHRRNASRRLVEIIDEMILKLETNPQEPSLIWALPFYNHAMDNIISYLPKDSIIVLDEPRSIDDKMKLLTNAHNIRVKSFVSSGEAVFEHENSIIGREDIYGNIKENTILAFQNVTSANPIFEPEYIDTIKAPAIPKYSLNYDMLVENITGNLMFGTRVFIYAGTMDSANYLQAFFSDAKMASVIDTSYTSDYPLVIYPYYLSRGFTLPSGQITVIGTDDIIRKSETRKKSLKRKRERFVMPEVGDFVVHEIHGIGISEGLVRLETRSGIKDYYLIRYKEGDKLYLPVDRMDELEKYTGGGSPTIHRLGSRDFERLKERVKTSIKKMAFDIHELYKKRMKVKGHVYQKDTYWQQEMEEDFEFEETDCQLLAISEIKKDMESGKVMDRLLCGDVGFGKTEVAIRAIFKTVIEGKQAVVLAPTTILCKQHYDTITKRLEKYNLNIEMLSRFVSNEKQTEIIKKLEEGTINIVVATHRILSKDIKFMDLGLLVLDEEQKFGVEQKEKIKVMKNNVNVLSLSATPVPRTLHMALSGIRDISTLETPPENRLPIETYVVEYTDALLVDAVKREIGRGGQVFILFNRVQGIERFYQDVKDMLEGVTITYAHGQMSPATLENRISDFYNGKYQVLISTTIIENGIDLPNANTLIVIDSDRLGLAELYQLRGRVGRSHNLAYAYFTVREGKVLTEEAVKRLDALMRYTELGSGFKIAMEDLEIRGAGNILGREQHGNMQKVGYDMYCRLLNESVKELQGEKVEETKQVELKIDGDIFLPTDYITASSRRVEFYKRISQIGSIEEEKELIKHYEDTDGVLPEPALRLLKMGLLKKLAQSIGVRQVVVTNYGMGLHFWDNTLFGKPDVFKALDRYINEAVLSPADPPMIVFNKSKRSQDEKIELMRSFLLVAAGYTTENA